MGRVIRGGGGHRPQGIVRLAGDRAALLAEARAEAAQVVTAAQERAGLVREAARAEGLELGRGELAAEWARLAAARRALLGDVRGDVLVLGLALARKLLGAELELAPERIEGILAQALERAGAEEDAAVRVHPADLPGAEAAIARRGMTGLRLVPDTSIERGGVVVTTSLGEVDARVGTRLAALRRALEAVPRGDAPGDPARHDEASDPAG